MAGSRVLVVSEDGDVHAAAVRAALIREHRIEPLVLDTTTFPSVGGYFTADASGVQRAFGDLLLDEVEAVWWRRAFPSAVPRSTSVEDDAYRQAECDGFAQGLLWSLAARWVNDPGAERIASRKIVQLVAARAEGFPVPETLITNDPDRAAAFLAARPGPTIFKRTGTSRAEFSETRMTTPEDVSRLGGIRTAPTTFQAYVEAEADLRVVWIEGRAWTVRIDSQTGTGWLDSRLDVSVPFSPYELPAETGRRLDGLMARLGLRFGVVDLRVDRAGEIWFLEVNPQGQFAYLEIKTGLPIFADLAACLAGARRS